MKLRRKKKPTPEQLLEHLANWNGSSRGVAEFLRFAGVKGRMGSSRRCPLANYLSRELGEPWSVWIGGPNDYFVQPTARYRLVAIPDSVRWFINEFDDGKYPFLVDEDPA